MSALTQDRVNGVEVAVLGKTVAAIRRDPELGKSVFRVHNRWLDGNHNCSAVTGFYGARQEQVHQQRFELHADEPAILAGHDQGANPVEHLLHALASCLTTSIIAHGAVRGIQIRELESDVDGDLDLRGFLGLSNDVPRGYTHIRARFRVKADGVDPRQLHQLAEYSPVYQTLRKSVAIDLQIEPVN
jgi:uncharacterized OsmC-like protein